MIRFALTFCILSVGVHLADFSLPPSASALEPAVAFFDQSGAKIIEVYNQGLSALG